MTADLAWAVAICLLAVAVILVANVVEHWHDADPDQEPPSNLDRYDWGGDR